MISRIAATQECQTMIFESQQRVEAAKNLAEALIVEGESEGNAAKSLKAKREYELGMAKAEVMEGIARKGRIVISGEQGDKLIGSVISSQELQSFDKIKSI